MIPEILTAMLDYYGMAQFRSGKNAVWDSHQAKLWADKATDMRNQINTYLETNLSKPTNNPTPKAAVGE